MASSPVVANQNNTISDKDFYDRVSAALTAGKSAKQIAESLGMTETAYTQRKNDVGSVLKVFRATWQLEGSKKPQSGAEIYKALRAQGAKITVANFRKADEFKARTGKNIAYVSGGFAWPGGIKGRGRQAKDRDALADFVLAETV